MSEAYIGEIRMFGFGFAPKGWALCNGQLMPINQNQALFALLGTYYGGNGVQTFGLPNLQGRVPLHMSGSYPLGGAAGEAVHTLQTSEIPSHTHSINGSSNSPKTPSPANNLWASGNSATLPYAESSDGSTMAPQAISPTGGQPHENFPPYLILNFSIALVGIFPPRN